MNTWTRAYFCRKNRGENDFYHGACIGASFWRSASAIGHVCVCLCVCESVCVFVTAREEICVCVRVCVSGPPPAILRSAQGCACHCKRALETQAHRALYKSFWPQCSAQPPPAGGCSAMVQRERRCEGAATLRNVRVSVYAIARGSVSVIAREPCEMKAKQTLP